MEFYISPQSGQFYVINVLENQWLSVTLRDKIKYVFIVPIVRQVALDNVPLRNGPSSQKFSEEPITLFTLSLTRPSLKITLASLAMAGRAFRFTLARQIMHCWRTIPFTFSLTRPSPNFTFNYM